MRVLYLLKIWQNVSLRYCLSCNVSNSFFYLKDTQHKFSIISKEHVLFVNQEMRVWYLSDRLTATIYAECTLPSLSGPFTILGLLSGFFFHFYYQILKETSVSKQWITRQEAPFCGVWSGFAMFANVPQKKTLGLYGLMGSCQGLHCSHKQEKMVNAYAKI